MLKDLRLQVPGLGRPRPVVHGVGEAVVRVVAPLLRSELREVAAAELYLGGRGERGTRSRFVPWAGGRVLSLPRFVLLLAWMKLNELLCLLLAWMELNELLCQTANDSRKHLKSAY